MANNATHMGPYVLEKRIHTADSRTLFYAPRAPGTRIPYPAAIYCLHHTHRKTEHIIEIEDDHRLLTRLHPPHFPRAIQLYPREFGFAREWIDGVSLREMLVMVHQSNTLLSQDTVYDIMAHLLNGYAQLQNATPPILHGRLNWDHILLGKDGRVAMIGLRAHRNDNTDSFSSPEQATTTFLDWRSDQWSLGAVFASLLLKESLYTGRPNPTYDSTKGDVTHWLDRIKTRFPHAYPVVSKMLHPAAGERYRHHSFIARDVQILCERFPNSERVALGKAASRWSGQSNLKPSQSVDSIVPSRVLPTIEPALQHGVLEVTEQIEPELESLIEVTQFNTPTLSKPNDGPLSSTPEPQLTVSQTRATNSAVEPDPIELEVTDIIKDTSKQSVVEVQLTPPTETSAKPAHTELDSTQGNTTAEPTASLDGLSLQEASLIAEVFASQQRAVLLMIVNGLLLIVLIWHMMF